MIIRLRIDHPVDGFRKGEIESLSERKPDRRLAFWELMATRRGEPPHYRYDVLESYEARLLNEFPRALTVRLQDVAESSSRDDEERWRAGKDRLSITCLNMRYGSLEMILTAFGLEKYAGILGVTVPAALTMLESSVPFALRQTLGLPDYMDFDVSAVTTDPVETSPPINGTADAASALAKDKALTKGDRTARAAMLLLSSYLIPIGLAVLVLYEAASMTREAVKSADDQRIAMLHEYADFTKAQAKIVSDERVELGKLASSILNGMEIDRRLLAEAIMKMTVDVNRETVKTLQNANDKPVTPPQSQKVATTVAGSARSIQR